MRVEMQHLRSWDWTLVSQLKKKTFFYRSAYVAGCCCPYLLISRTGNPWKRITWRVTNYNINIPFGGLHFVTLMKVSHWYLTPKSLCFTFVLISASAGVFDSDVGTQPWRRLFASIINCLHSSRIISNTLFSSPVSCRQCSFVHAINYKQPGFIYRFKLITLLCRFC
jgi:hypothetical protein